MCNTDLALNVRNIGTRVIWFPLPGGSRASLSKRRSLICTLRAHLLTHTHTLQAKRFFFCLLREEHLLLWKKWSEIFYENVFGMFILLENYIQEKSLDAYGWGIPDNWTYYNEHGLNYQGEIFTIGRRVKTWYVVTLLSTFFQSWKFDGFELCWKILYLAKTIRYLLQSFLVIGPKSCTQRNYHRNYPE